MTKYSIKDFTILFLHLSIFHVCLHYMVLDFKRSQNNYQQPSQSYAASEASSVKFHSKTICTFEVYWQGNIKQVPKFVISFIREKTKSILQCVAKTRHPPLIGKRNKVMIVFIDYHNKFFSIQHFNMYRKYSVFGKLTSNSRVKQQIEHHMQY